VTQEKHSSPLVLSPMCLFVMSLTFRFYFRQRLPSFGPGLRHMIRYEWGRLSHLLHDYLSVWRYRVCLSQERRGTAWR
jgi:hypothetical protein